MNKRACSACPFFCFLVFLLFACANRPALPTVSLPLDLPGVLPAGEPVPGWSAVADAAAVYDRQNLYNLVDGQAESFFAYGFEQVIVQRYQDSASVWLNIEIWQLATPADAFGLFAAGKAGQPAEIGITGDIDPGRRLAFWQDRYFVSLGASQPVEDAVLYGFANLVSAALPDGGSLPALVTGLPSAGLVAGSPRFFHEEISIQNDLWLGGENLLGLSQETDGVLARYEIGGETTMMLWIEYPTSKQAAEAASALQAAGTGDLLASRAKDRQLVALFGTAEPAAAQSFLDEILK